MCSEKRFFVFLDVLRRMVMVDIATFIERSFSEVVKKYHNPITNLQNYSKIIISIKSFLHLNKNKRTLNIVYCKVHC